MGNAARKARKRAGIKFERKQKIPTGKLGKPYYGLPEPISPEAVKAAAAIGRAFWESRSFR